MAHTLTLLLMIVLLLSAITDLWWQKIPNWITFPGMTVAMIFHTVLHGLEGLLFSIEGIGTGIALLLVFYVLGGMGAGDAKLLGAVGGFVGPSGVLSAFLMTALIGGIYALALLVMQWGGRKAMRRVVTLLETVLLTRSLSGSLTSEPQPKLRYGVVIALGTVASQWWGDRLFVA